MQTLTAVVTELIRERPLCFPCLSEQSGATRSEIGTVLRGVEAALMIHLSNRRCYGCGEFVDVVSLDRQAN